MMHTCLSFDVQVTRSDCCYSPTLIAHNFVFQCLVARSLRSSSRSETLFRTLEAIRRLNFSTRSGRLLPAVFVHLPDYVSLPQPDMVKLIQGLGMQLSLLQ
jgi:hypothetical protein